MKGLSIIVLCGMLFLFKGSNFDTTAKAVSIPIIISVSPSHIFNDQEVTITIEGTGFVDAPTVTAATCNVPIVTFSNVTFVDSTTLTATVPADLPEGIYDIFVKNQDGQISEPGIELTIMRRGDGSFGPWNMASSMTTKRWRFAAVAGNDYLYALGGIGDGKVQSSVERAKINPDGSLGPWQVISALSTPRVGLAAVAVNDYIYALGGGETNYTGPAYNSVERAKINSDGSLGPWQVSSSMISPRFYPSAVATGGYLYAIGGYSVVEYSEGMKTVERAAINPDGSLGPWKATASTYLVRSIAVAYGDYIYALGGDNSVERARVNPDGSLESWQFVSSMPDYRIDFAAVAAEGYLYVLGSFYPCIYLTNSVERAAIKSDGALGPWELTASMQVGRAGFTAVAADKQIYAMDGSSVEYATIYSKSNYWIFVPLIRR